LSDLPISRDYEYLSKYRLGRRTLKKEKKLGNISYKSPEQIAAIIRYNKWPYRTRRDFYHTRDLALPSLLFLTSGRINEVLRVTKDQFKEYELDPDILLLRSFYVSKRQEGQDNPTPNIPLPRVGASSPLTRNVESYLEMLGSEDKLFKFSRARAWAIIRHITKRPGASSPGYWCHWFRAQSLSHQVNLIRSTIAVAKQRGVANPATLAHYYTGDWKLFKDEIKR
jgi:hypothetical protein